MAKQENIIYVGNQELLNYYHGPLTLTEMENDYELGKAEWDVLEKIKLSPRQKECMYLRYWGSENQKPVSQQEIAGLLSISRRSVRTHLKRARRKIKIRCRQKTQLKDNEEN